MSETRSIDPRGEGVTPVDLEHRRLGPRALTRWLTRLVPSLTTRWIEDIRERGHAGPPETEGLVARFAELLVGLLPLMLGPHRDQIHPLWDRTSELYGVMAARRGLAAGEAIEEVHALRELVIRELYQKPPADGTVRLSLREVLRLNRALDRAATHVSVGHTDALFFEFFQSEGGGSGLGGAEAVEEARAQLKQIEAEVEESIGRRLHNGPSGLRG